MEHPGDGDASTGVQPFPAYGRGMAENPVAADIAPVAGLMADRTRATMLNVLLDGRPLAAGELAHIAGVSAATASSHLSKLLGGGLVTVVQQGRHRYYRLNGRDVAAAVEAVALISPPLPARSLRQSRQAAALQEARTCYDHLAGRAGTTLLAALMDRGLVELADGRGEDGSSPPGRPYDVTPKGEHLLGDLGVDVPALRRGRRRFAADCLDWTQRTPHLNGALGAAITTSLIDHGWFEHGPQPRALRLTDLGRKGLTESFGIVLP
jgi:DNA-binding transcriptional ArsR family regulator